MPAPNTSSQASTQNAPQPQTGEQPRATPEQFYARFASRADVRELLRRLAQ